MARSKKIAKNAVKRRPKQQKQSRPVIAKQQTEKDFMHMPAKLLINLNKEVATLEKQESKLAAMLNKLNTQIAKAKKHLSQTKSPQTAAAKKQYQLNKKTYQTNLKTQAALIKQLAQIAKLHQVVKQRQAKLQALSKYLKEFEKIWVKSVKQAQSSKKAKTRTKRKPTVKIQKTSEQQEDTHFSNHDTPEYIQEPEEALETTS